MQEQTIPGKPLSLWMDTTPVTSYPYLQEDIEVDVAILGAGIAGLTAADCLTEAGADVAVIEASHVCAGVTGFTTAKITSLHTLVYSKIVKDFGEEKARLYGEANQWAIEHIAGRVDSYGTDCDFIRDDAFTYAITETGLQSVRDEVKAAQSVGRPAEFTTDTSLPFKVLGSVRFPNQARFHPRKYMLSVAEQVSRRGGRIFELTRACELHEKDNRWQIITERGTVWANHVMVLTHYPFFDPAPALYITRLYPVRAYAMAVRVRDPLPVGMHISCDVPERSVRRQPYGDSDVLIIGGENHKAGQDPDTRNRYLTLAQWAQDNFTVEEFLYRWSTQDNSTADGLPYIGQISKRSERAYVATGFDGWGMTTGTVAGRLLADLVLGRPNAWADLYDPNRSEAKGIGTIIKENLNVANQLIGGKLHGAEWEDIRSLLPGEAKVINSSKGHIAAYRAPTGEFQVHSASCTHMGCTLKWNTAETSWDCPCHGSRFAADGRVLQGPAIKDLPRVDFEDAEK